MSHCSHLKAGCPEQPIGVLSLLPFTERECSAVAGALTAPALKPLVVNYEMYLHEASQFQVFSILSEIFATVDPLVAEYNVLMPGSVCLP
jgi:hypothetical protein